MNQLTMTAFTPALGYGQAHGIAVLTGPRELTEAEIEMVGGGFPIVIAPIVIKGAEIAAAAFIGGFFGAAGAASFDYFFNDHTGSR